MRLYPNSLLYCNPCNYTDMLQSCTAHLHRHLRPLHMQFSSQHAMYMHYKTVVHPFCCCVQSVCCRRYGGTMLVATLSKMSWYIMRRMTRCMCTLQSHAMRRSSAFTLVSISTCHSVHCFAGSLAAHGVLVSEVFSDAGLISKNLFVFRATTETQLRNSSL